MGDIQGIQIKSMEVFQKNTFGGLHVTFEFPIDVDIYSDGIPKANYIVSDKSYYGVRPQYFIDAISVRGNIMRITATLDVINTYSKQIRKAKAIIRKTSNPDSSTKRLSCNTWVYDVGKIIYPMNFPNTGFFNYDDPAKIMVTIKGNK